MVCKFVTVLHDWNQLVIFLTFCNNENKYQDEQPDVLILISTLF